MPYLKPEDRKEEIMIAAIVVAERDGFMVMRREDVAKQAKCANGSVNRYFGNMNQLRRAVMRRAVTTKNLQIIAQGIVVKDKHAMKAPPELKTAAAIHAVVG